MWSHHALTSSGLSEDVKRALCEQAEALRPSKLLFIRRRERRGDDGVAVFLARSTPGRESLSRLDVDGYDDLLALDLAAAEPPGRPVDHPLFLVCTHGKHDRCCARRGRPLYDALHEQAEEGWVWQSTHVGGDRFAGNVVVLPEGLYYGRVEPADAWPLLDDHLGRRVCLQRFRGRSSYPFFVQAAEIEIRTQARVLDVDALRLEEVRPHGEGWTVRFGVPREGYSYEVEVVTDVGELTYLTCAAATLKHPRRFAAGGPPERAA